MQLRSLTGVSRRDDADEKESRREFARWAGRALAEWSPADLSEGSLALLFAASAWLRLAGTNVQGACASLLELRSALLECSNLDTASEPVPLLAGEPRVALLGVATYLHGLVGRAARSAGKCGADLVEEALELFA